MNFRRHAAFACLATLISFAYPLANPVSAESISLDYSQLTALPSATGQGLTYIGSSGVSESSVYSVANGALHVDTIGPKKGDIYAYYDLSPGYDSSLDAEMTFTTRVSATSNGFGLVFSFSDANAASAIVVNTGNWLFYGQAISGTFADPSAFHTFDLKTTGATHTFTLTIDGVLVASGNQHAGYAGASDLYFGDGTPTGGNVTGDIKSYTFSNPAVVPEPSSLALVGLGLAAVAGLAGRRRSRAIGR